MRRTENWSLPINKKCCQSVNCFSTSVNNSKPSIEYADMDARKYSNFAESGVMEIGKPQQNTIKQKTFFM